MLKKSRTTRIKALLNNDTPKILIQRADRLGDLVQALPAIDALAARFPQAKLYLLCSDRNRALLSCYPYFSGSFCFNIDASPTQEEKQRIIQEITDHAFDLYLSLWAHPFYDSLGKHAGIPVRIGPHTSPLSFYTFTHPIPLPWHHIHIHEQHMNMMCLRPLGIAPAPPRPLAIPTFSTPDLHPATTLPSLLFFCGTGKAETMISERTLLAIITKLLASNRYFIYIIYGDTSGLSTLQALHHPRLCNITSFLNLTDVIALIAHVDIYCGPDTGPTHLAVALQKKAAIFYKSTQNPPLRWGPFLPYCTITRFDYCSEGPVRSYREVNHYLNAIERIHTQTTPLSRAEQYALLETTTLRFIWLCESLGELMQDRPVITQLRREGWVIFVHIKRRNPLTHLQKLVALTTRYPITAVYSNTYQWFFTLYNLWLNLRLRPRLVVVQKPYRSCTTSF